MHSGLLEPKLYVPHAPPDVVVRSHLIARIEEGLQSRLTLLSAPAGAGKTTLLSAWRDTPIGIRWPLAWVSLDEDDNEPARFWAYVCTAITRALPSAGEAALGLLRSAKPGSLQAVITSLVNDVSGVDEPLALVLDDYHAIQTPAIHDGLRFLLDHLPPNLHLVLATRADPPLPLARLRASGHLVELLAADLRFTPDEAVTFLARSMRLQLTPEMIVALSERTEGWAVGLKLAALALQGQTDARAFVVRFAGTHRYVVDYLVDEVLQQQPPDVQQFLLDSAILERVNGSLCEAVTGSRDATQMLERLHDANLFLLPLDDERRWYRYHQLFADVLRHYLERTRPASVGELHRRAARWFQDQRLTRDAVHHAFLGHDQALAAEIIEDGARRSGCARRNGNHPRVDIPVAGRRGVRTAAAWTRALLGARVHEPA